MDAEQPKMTRAEFDRLLSAYSSGSIQDDEREILFQAAMEEQSFFNALADEESLRDVLQHPGFGAELRRELAPEPKRPFWLRPWPLLAGGMLAAVIVGTVFFWRAQIPLAPGMVANRVTTPEAPTAAVPPSVAVAPDAAAKKTARKSVAARKAEAPAPAAALPETTPPVAPEPAPAAAAPPKPVLAEDQRQQVMPAPQSAAVAGAEPRLSALRESVQLDTASPQRARLTSQVTSFMGKPFQHALANGVLAVTAHRDGHLYVLALIGGEWKTLESSQIVSGVSRPIPITGASEALIALTPQPVPNPTPANLRQISGAFVETVTIR